MCLAIPSKIVRIEESDTAVIDVDGVSRKCSLLLVENAEVGNYVIVHAGFALRIIDEEEALESLRYLKDAAAMMDERFRQNDDDVTP